MAIFTAIVAAIGLTGIAAAVASTVLAVGASFVVSKLIAPRGATGNSQQEDSVTGSRVQLPPATNNKLPVVYGTAFVGGSITDAKISTDLQSMWYVISIAEVTNTMPGDTPDTITFDELYYDGKLVSLSGAQVTSLTTNTAGTPEVDTKINGNLFIYLFPNGSSSGTNTGGLSAIDIMSDAEIPLDQRWNQGIYTAGGQSAAMTNTAFVIVKVKYNQDAGTTSLGAVTAKITNSRTKPGDCITDYLLSDRYGCAVPLAGIDTASMTALNDYSDKTIVYTPMGGGPTTTQVRYRFNGPLDTTKNCLANLQDMVDACDSWMQYSELTGKWKVVINKAYDETPDALTFSQLYSVTNNNLTSGIQVNPTDLNQTFNQVEYQYPNTNIKDQLDFIFISLQDDFPSLLSENEPVNKLGLKNDLVNNYVQAKFIAIRRILQGREDLIINLQTDYSGIQVEAGDVIRVTNEVYGWTNKLFRVSNVIEEKDVEGNLFARLTAFEYNATIYDDDLDITDFIPADNTGLQDPNIISQPDVPVVVANVDTTLNFIEVSGNVPNVGLVTHLDFNYGFDSNVDNHTFYTTVYNSNGAPLINSQLYSAEVNDIAQAGNIYWSTTAKNQHVGIQSNSSTPISWAGANVSVFDPIGNTGGITGNNIQYGTITANNLANGASKIDVQDEGTTIINTGTINFVGSAVTVSNIGNVATVTVTGGGGGGLYEYINDSSFALGGGVNPPEAINQKLSYGTARIPSNRQANASTGNFETYTFDSFYPWYTGNSLTTNGYLANSGSGRCNPANAGLQDIASPVNMGGRAGWWTLIGAAVTSGYRTANTQIRSSSQVQIMCDETLVVQTAGWYQIQEIANTSNISNAIKMDTTISTTLIEADTPQMLNLDFSVEGNANFVIYDVGMCMRVVTGGTDGNIIVMTGTSVTSKPNSWDFNNLYWLVP
jgi:hypothetical protein